MGLVYEDEIQQYVLLRRTKKYRDRALTNMLLREAMEGRFRWPRNWPQYKTKLVMNLVKPITLRSANLLMGKGFKWQVNPLNQDKDERIKAQAIERGLDRIVSRSGGVSLFSAGAQDGALVGDSVFKTYLDEESKWPKIAHCLPEFFYGIPASSDYMGELAKVYYAWYIDPLEAKEKWPDKFSQMRTEDKVDWQVQPERGFGSRNGVQDGVLEPGLRKRMPVVEIWTQKDYLLIVGGVKVFNGANPYKFVPFTSIPNIRISGQVEGQGDAEQVLTLNEELNQILSHRAYVIRRWLNPTLVWEGAPPNYKEILAAIVGGGGALPTRPGTKVEFLQQGSNGPDVDDLLDRMRKIGLENANTNELAMTGQVHGSINTGSALDRQLLPVTSLVDDKKRSWEIGLKRLAGQLLQLTQLAEAVKDYGSAYLPTEKGTMSGAEEVPLNKVLFKDYRDVEVTWPGTLASEDAQLANLEIQKYVSGLQSLYTTLERLGFDYPTDEIERIRDERTDPDLHPEIANQALQAAAPLMAQQNDAAQEAAQTAADAQFGAASNGRHNRPGAYASPPQPVSPFMPGQIPGAPGAVPPGAIPQGKGKKGRTPPPQAPGVQVDANGNPIIQ